MMNSLRTLFGWINKTQVFLFRKHRMGFNGFTIVFIFIILIGGILNEIFNQKLIEWIAALLILLFCLGYSFAFINERKIKKYIFFGEKTTLKDISTVFSFYSYIISLICITPFICIPIIGIVSGLSFIGDGKFSEILLSNKLIIFYTMIFIESILWFAYHIVNGNVDIQDIKIKVSLFSALAATILIFADVLLMLKNFKLILSYIAGSYFWVNFLIELRVKELHTSKVCNSEG